MGDYPILIVAIAIAGVVVIVLLVFAGLCGPKTVRKRALDMLTKLFGCCNQSKDTDELVKEGQLAMSDAQKETEKEAKEMRSAVTSQLTDNPSSSHFIRPQESLLGGEPSLLG